MELRCAYYYCEVQNNENESDRESKQPEIATSTQTSSDASDFSGVFVVPIKNNNPVVHLSDILQFFPFRGSPSSHATRFRFRLRMRTNIRGFLWVWRDLTSPTDIVFRGTGPVGSSGWAGHHQQDPNPTIVLKIIDLQKSLLPISMKNATIQSHSYSHPITKDDVTSIVKDYLQVPPAYSFYTTGGASGSTQQALPFARASSSSPITLKKVQKTAMSWISSAVSGARELLQGENEAFQQYRTSGGDPSQLSYRDNDNGRDQNGNDQFFNSGKAKGTTQQKNRIRLRDCPRLSSMPLLVNFLRLLTSISDQKLSVKKKDVPSDFGGKGKSIASLPLNERLQWQILQTIWSSLFQGKKLERKGMQWRWFGFQSNDPSNDLRGCGMLALHFIGYLASVHQRKWVAMCKEQIKRRNNSATKQSFYPIATAAINVLCHILNQLQTSHNFKEGSSILNEAIVVDFTSNVIDDQGLSIRLNDDSAQDGGLSNANSFSSVTAISIPHYAVLLVPAKSSAQSGGTILSTSSSLVNKWLDQALLPLFTIGAHILFQVDTALTKEGTGEMGFNRVLKNVTNKVENKLNRYPECEAMIHSRNIGRVDAKNLVTKLQNILV
eukprot:g1004.t1